MNADITILDAMSDPRLFGPWFQGVSWNAWRAFLAALFGLPMIEGQPELFRKFTGRQTPPTKPFREAWLCCGRRSGKSRIAALIAVYLAFFRDYSKYLAPGERLTIMLIAADRRQARVLMRFIRAFILEIQMFASMVVGETKESIEISNCVVIEIHTSSDKSIRGYTGFCINDEIAYWPTDDSAESDREIIAAERPMMATIPDAILLSLSSPRALAGAMGDAYRMHYGKDDSQVLFWKAPTLAMHHDEHLERVVQEAYEQDSDAAAADYGADFRSDLERPYARENAEACVVKGRWELPAVSGLRYFSFCDPSGGSADSMTLGIAHRDQQGRAVLDCLRERRPPFSPESVVAEFSSTLRAYGISQVSGDRYGGEWPRERFRLSGIEYKTAEKTKSELYLELLPLLNSGRVELLDNPRLIAQLVGLERRTSRGGRDSVDHSPGSHDDVANAAAGALVGAASQREAQPWIECIRFSTDGSSLAGRWSDEPGWRRIC